MLYNLQNKKEVDNFDLKVLHFKKLGKTVELIEKKNTRSNKQNKALHLLYSIICTNLNDIGLTYKYIGLKGAVIETRYTSHIVKEFIWRPIQIAMFNVQSTTKINTTQINEIVDVLAKFHAEKGIVIEFPSKEQIEKLIN